MQNSNIEIVRVYILMCSADYNDWCQFTYHADLFFFYRTKESKSTTHVIYVFYFFL